MSKFGCPDSRTSVRRVCQLVFFSLWIFSVAPYFVLNFVSFRIFVFFLFRPKMSNLRFQFLAWPCSRGPCGIVPFVFFFLFSSTSRLSSRPRSGLIAISHSTTHCLSSLAFRDLVRRGLFVFDRWGKKKNWKFLSVSLLTLLYFFFFYRDKYILGPWAKDSNANFKLSIIYATLFIHTQVNTYRIFL